MSQRSPLGTNHGWVVNTDRLYSSRELTDETHGVLAVTVVVQDADLMQLEKSLGYKVILAVRLGVRTVHLRVYKREEVEKRPDNLQSRLALPDHAAFMIFNDTGGVTLLEGRLRDMAQGHIPAFYADRILTPKQVAATDGLQLQITGALPKKFGLPKAESPLEDEDGEPIVVIHPPEPPTLESA